MRKGAGDQLDEWTDQVMMQIARMLPPEYRGVYAARVGRGRMTFRGERPRPGRHSANPSDSARRCGRFWPREAAIPRRPAESGGRRPASPQLLPGLAETGAGRREGTHRLKHREPQGLSPLQPHHCRIHLGTGKNGPCRQALDDPRSAVELHSQRQQGSSAGAPPPTSPPLPAEESAPSAKAAARPPSAAQGSSADVVRQVATTL